MTFPLHVSVFSAFVSFPLDSGDKSFQFKFLTHTYLTFFERINIGKNLVTPFSHARAPLVGVTAHRQPREAG